eukprot:scaffold65_cov353-Prasinococcus_capsulatus_cf.AAC.21
MQGQFTAEIHEARQRVTKVMKQKMEMELEQQKKKFAQEQAELQRQFSSLQQQHATKTRQHAHTNTATAHNNGSHLQQCRASGAHGAVSMDEIVNLWARLETSLLRRARIYQAFLDHTLPDEPSAPARSAGGAQPIAVDPRAADVGRWGRQRTAAAATGTAEPQRGRAQRALRHIRCGQGEQAEEAAAGEQLLPGRPRRAQAALQRQGHSAGHPGQWLLPRSV